MSERSKAVRNWSLSLLLRKSPVLGFLQKVLRWKFLLYAAVLLHVAPETPLLPITNQQNNDQSSI